ncbi:hypothetical protein IAD21_03834 [Abditibacteriota bacterium]|nr:hypothetical protein IAD21_03834 [Abditibacteriota bacterium]
MKCQIFVALAALSAIDGVCAQGNVGYIGQSRKCRVLDVSPDGKWLLSWDGVTYNTPSTSPGDRFVWNLATKTSRYISTWPGFSSGLYDLDCGWTPDGLIWQLDAHSQPLGEGNAPFIAAFYLQKPDGSERKIISDPNPRVWFDDTSFYDDVTDFKFSPDGVQLVYLTDSYFRIFNARTGKMIFRRRLSIDERQTAFLSPDRTRILTQSGVTYDEQEGVQDAGKWALRDARSGRLIRRLRPVPKALLTGFAGDDAFAYQQGTTLAKARLSDGKVLLKETFAPLKQVNNNLLKLRDSLSLRTQTWKAPSNYDWFSFTITSDRKTMFGVMSDFIYRFPAEEVKP